MLEDEAAAPKSKKNKAPAKEAASGPALNLLGGFQWNATGEDDDEGSSDNESDDENVAGPSTQAPVKKQKATKGIQQDFTGDLATKTPESTSDYERLLLSSPDSSFLWIQYMSFQLSMSEVQKAREVARRALKAISFREETEKLNVWLALLNLENSYGTEEEAEATFKEAIQFNEPKTVHLRMAGIFEQTEKFEVSLRSLTCVCDVLTDPVDSCFLQRAEDILKRAAKKFSQSSKVWTIYGEYHFNRGDAEAARALLPRSLKSLPKRKRKPSCFPSLVVEVRPLTIVLVSPTDVKTITKFAQLEYRLGDAERGRTIFEGVVDSYPKRLDLWNVYIDLETKQGDIQSVRSVHNLLPAVARSPLTVVLLFRLAEICSLERLHASSRKRRQNRSSRSGWRSSDDWPRRATTAGPRWSRPRRLRSSRARARGRTRATTRRWSRRRWRRAASGVVDLACLLSFPSVSGEQVSSFPSVWNV